MAWNITICISILELEDEPNIFHPFAHFSVICSMRLADINIILLLFFPNIDLIRINLQFFIA